MQTQVLTPNQRFSKLASDEQIRRTARSLESNGIRTIIVNDGEEAKQKVLDILPAGAEVFDSTSRTLDAIGLASEIGESQRYEKVRDRLSKLDQKTQAEEMRKTGAAPNYIIGSVHAVTEDGQVLIASATGSQLGPYAYGAGSVIWVVGAQKIVKNLDEAMRRIQEYSFPLEDKRAHDVYGTGSGVNKVLIVNREVQPGRIRMVLVKENLGF